MGDRMNKAVKVGILLAFSSALQGGFAQAQESATPAADGAEGKPAQTSVAPTATPAVRIALLLPTQSTSLGPMAQAVKSGFFAAHDYVAPGVAVDLIETDDNADTIVANYVEAQKTHDYIVGPLTRSALVALIKSRKIQKTTIALAQTEQGEEAASVPPNVITMGLSVEDEARQAAQLLAREKPGSAVLAVASSAAWQRRAARAFVAEAKRRGLTADSVEIESGGGYMGAAGLQDLQKRVKESKRLQLFYALDAAQARQVRLAIGPGVAAIGTSQLNPIAGGDRSGSQQPRELEGMRLLDLPWQLQPDHPAVMVFPRLVADAGQRISAETERMYALGIDAFRVVHELSLSHASFDLDGVTGQLKVQSNGGQKFSRTEVLAVYREGTVQAVSQ